MKKVFIDGSEGTTGLRIGERLAGRDDLELLRIDPDLRKDPAERKKLLNAADIAVLCLPDAAAREAVALVENPDTVVIDASTAHRTQPGWAYGFPELGDNFRDSLAQGKRIAVPGCHASGFIALMRPLTCAGVVAPDYPVVCHSVTGYSGGGKSMIADYQGGNPSPALESPRQYGLGQVHKHQPEMKRYGGLWYAPVFNPIVADFYAGMAVSVPLHTRAMARPMTPAGIRELFREFYEGQALVSVAAAQDERVVPKGFLAANLLAGCDDMVLYVDGNDDRLQLTALFDNLGKGASGAAVQCLNIAIGADETRGLTLWRK